MTKQKKTQPGRVIYHGSVQADDPRYSSGWNFLSPKNLRPEPPEREPVAADPDQEKPAS
jgi:hypothetical protein